jgi:hypothetical protein
MSSSAHGAGECRDKQAMMVHIALAEITIQVTGGGTVGSDAGRRAGLVLLLGFLLSFVFIRISTRLMRSPKVPWWPGSIKTEGGLHLHHLVFGIVLLILTGFFAFAIQPASPWLEILAAGFGIGCGLTLDEYALILHLEDVYWAEEGRRSIDAVIMATLVGGAIVVGLMPWQTDNQGSVVAFIVAEVINLGLCLIAVFKGKPWTGVFGMFVPPIGWIGAIRLAKPGSPWAKRRYPAGSRKLERASARDAKRGDRYQRWQDRIGGAPDPTEAPAAKSYRSGH